MSLHLLAYDKTRYAGSASPARPGCDDWNFDARRGRPPRGQRRRKRQPR